MTLKSQVYNPEQLIRAHQRPVWRFLMAIGCNQTEAQDLTQETFVTILRDGFEYRGERETANYLFKVAKNKFISNARKRQRAPLVTNLNDVDADWTGFEKQMDGDARIEALEDCMKTLTERSRQALTLRYREELSRDEMARRLQLTGAGIKTLLGRIRAKLRDCVEKRFAHE